MGKDLVKKNNPKKTNKPPETKNSNSDNSNKARFAATNRPLTVDIWTSKKSYRNGELMRIHIVGNRNFYGKVMYEDVSGNIIRLLPNSFRKNNFFKAGREYVIPGKGDQFQLTVQAPFGNERISVFASTEPTGNAGGRQLDNGMVLVKEKDRKKLALQVRNVKITPTKSDLPTKGPAEFYEAVYRVRTRP